MITGRVAVRYARALVKFAEERDVVDKVVYDFDYIRTVGRRSVEFVDMLKNRSLTFGRRTQIIDSIFKDKINDHSYRFIMFLNDRGRLNLLIDIVDNFLRIIAEKRGLLEGELVSSREFDPIFVNQLTKKLSDSYGKKVMLNLLVDNRLIGGFRLKLGDKVYDYSVAGQLKFLEQELSERFL